MDQVVTKKGTVLPLLNLKGKKYLMIAYRIQWMNEEVENFSVTTEFLLMTDDQAVAKATVTIMDKDGKTIKTAMATKRETKKDFPDFTEKAETAAIGRAISILGFGTQFALSDLDENMRLADSPLVVPEKAQVSPDVVKADVAPEKEQPKKASSSFRKQKTEVVVTPAQELEWS